MNLGYNHALSKGARIENYEVQDVLGVGGFGITYKAHDHTLDQTVAIGDGANDRLMLGQAGLGIAYNAHQALKRSASVTLGHKRLMNILYILGITEEDMQPASR